MRHRRPTLDILRNRDGGSLIGVLVFSFVAAMGVRAISQKIEHEANAVNHIDLRQRVQLIKKHVSARTSCAKTKASWLPGCTGSVAVLDAAGNTFIPKDGVAKIERWLVRARCSGQDLIIDAALPTKDDPNKFRLDPLTGKALDWTAIVAPEAASTEAMSAQGNLINSNEGFCRDAGTVVVGDENEPKMIASKKLIGSGSGSECSTSTPVRGVSNLCPTGKTVVGGSVVCLGKASHTGVSVQSIAASYPDGNRWAGTCCKAEGIAVEAICY